MKPVYYEPNTREAHRVALQAKELIFKAQDAAGRMPQPSATGRRARRKVEQFHRLVAGELARARAALETLDRAMLLAQADDNEQCTCGGYERAEPHYGDCPVAAWVGDR